MSGEDANCSDSLWFAYAKSRSANWSNMLRLSVYDHLHYLMGQQIANCVDMMQTPKKAIRNQPSVAGRALVKASSGKDIAVPRKQPQRSNAHRETRTANKAKSPVEISHVA